MSHCIFGDFIWKPTLETYYEYLTAGNLLVKYGFPNTIDPYITR